MADGSATGDASPGADSRRIAWRVLPKRMFVALASLDTLLVLAYFALIALGRSESDL